MIAGIIALTIVCLAIIVYHWFSLKEEKEEKRRLINALIARNAREAAELEMADKLSVNVQKPETEKEQDDLIEVAKLSEEDFEEHIL